MDILRALIVQILYGLSCLSAKLVLTKYFVYIFMLKSNLWRLNQGRVLREFSPEEVTSNLYTMVDVLLHQIQIEQQRGHPVQVWC